MRGSRDPQATMLAFVDLEERVPQDHPIRTIKSGSLNSTTRPPSPTVTPCHMSMTIHNMKK